MTAQVTETNEVRQYEHDCDVCIFLGTMPAVADWADEGAESVDLYVCPRAGNKRANVVARYGSDGAYSSGMAAVGLDPHLTETHRRAQERGLLSDVRERTGQWDA